MQISFLIKKQDLLRIIYNKNTKYILKKSLIISKYKSKFLLLDNSRSKSHFIYNLLLRL